MWSFGVCLHAYVTGAVPFYASGGELEMQINARTKPLVLPKEGLSKELAHLITQLLEKDPAKRPTAGEVLEHPFFMKGLGPGEEGKD
jgi:serine/threonine protein kinase